MGDERLAAVADTGPLIHLAEVNCLMLLEIFRELHVPEAVWQEAERPPELRAALSSAHRHRVRPAELARFTAQHGFDRLQAGEQECLMLCSMLGVPVLLTDDLAARDAARVLGFTPVGSMGIIARAFQLGRLTTDAAERRLRDLASKSSLFVTPAIVELAIERLRTGTPGAR